VKLGDPCFNLLHFPEGIDQTEHTHPSDRIGMVIRGLGECVVDGGETIIPLEAGMIFCIHTDGLHKFRTLRGSEMTVLAYHPDSDFGPTDTFHPMLNRTIVNGVSASKLPEIQTKEIRA
jgi:quercetin dioxygenase-like cupin family protein